MGRRTARHHTEGDRYPEGKRQSTRDHNGETGTSLPRSSATATIAPMTENVKTDSEIDRPSHPAKVGRERGRESPIPESPARVARTGRSAPSKVCTDQGRQFRRRAHDRRTALAATRSLRRSHRQP